MGLYCTFTGPGAVADHHHKVYTNMRPVVCNRDHVSRQQEAVRAPPLALAGTHQQLVHTPSTHILPHQATMMLPFNHIVLFYAHSLPKVDSRLLLLLQPLTEADASHMRPSPTAATAKPHWTPAVAWQAAASPKFFQPGPVQLTGAYMAPHDAAATSHRRRAPRCHDSSLRPRSPSWGYHGCSACQVTCRSRWVITCRSC